MLHRIKLGYNDFIGLCRNNGEEKGGYYLGFRAMPGAAPAPGNRDCKG